MNDEKQGIISKEEENTKTNNFNKEIFLSFYNKLFSTDHKQLISLKISEYNYEILFLNDGMEEEEKIVSVDWMNELIGLTNELSKGLSELEFIARYNKINSGFF